MKNLNLLAAAIISTLFFQISCSDTITEVNYERIDTRLELTLKEELSVYSRLLSIDCATERIYPCINYGIDYSMTKSSNKITIRFNQIIMPEICLTALGPAYSNIKLGNLSNGLYILNLLVNGKTQTANLKVNDSTFKIEYEPGFDFIFKKTELKRIPQNVIWGSVGYINDTLTTSVNSFLDSLIIIGASEINLSPGDYGYFQIDSFGKIVAPEYHGYPFIKMYLYEFNGSSESLKELIRNTNQRFLNNMYISCNTWKGEYIWGW
jgi:hypothetical protein